MSKTGWLIALLSLLVLSLSVVLAFFLGQRSAEGREAKSEAAARQAQPPAISATPRPSPPVEDLDMRARRWLIGSWAMVSSQCATDDGNFFAADGRYGSYDQEGRWTLKGNVVTLRITKKSDSESEEWRTLAKPVFSTMRLERTGEDRMTQTIDGKPYRMMRCQQGKYIFGDD